MKHAKTLFLHTLTPLHSGTGQTAAVIDLPIAREKTTGWPVIPASSLKGVVRNGRGLNRDKDHKRIPDMDADRLYGVADGEDTRAGEVIFGDMHLLCFPARSLYGTFAYLTCPLALKRLRRDTNALGDTLAFDVPEPGIGEAIEIVVTQTSVLAQGNDVILDDLDLTKKSGENADSVAQKLAALAMPEAEREAFCQRFAIVPDDVFNYLTQSACEITARVAMDWEKGTKTVRGGGLWYEEAVPAEAIFHGPYCLAGRVAEVSELPEPPKLLQLGGKESVGRGWCRLRVSGGN
jgi:CRISPR-associated protein Cmr4